MAYRFQQQGTSNTDTDRHLIMPAENFDSLNMIDSTL